MYAKNLLFTVLGCLLALGLTTPTSAQDSSDTNALAEQLAALQIMNSTVGPMITQANTRNQQMVAFIKAKNMESDWDAFNSSSKAPNPQSLTFDEGYKVALERVQKEQPVTKTDHSAEDLKSNISATKTLVQSEWSNYHNVHKMSVRLSAFLQSKGAMSDYETWSKTYSEKRAAEFQKRMNEENAKQSDAAKRIRSKFKAQQRYLMQHWDEEMHLKGLANSSGYIMARNRQSIVADSHQYPYLDSQTDQVNLNTANEPFGEGSGYAGSYGPGYYDGSWYGGYADPHYDVWGFPGDNDGDDPYARTHPPHYHPGALAGGNNSMEGSGRK